MQNVEELIDENQIAELSRLADGMIKQIAEILLANRDEIPEELAVWLGYVLDDNEEEIEKGLARATELCLNPDLWQ